MSLWHLSTKQAACCSWQYCPLMLAMLSDIKYNECPIYVHCINPQSPKCWCIGVQLFPLISIYLWFWYAIFHALKIFQMFSDILNTGMLLLILFFIWWMTCTWRPLVTRSEGLLSHHQRASSMLHSLETQSVLHMLHQCTKLTAIDQEEVLNILRKRPSSESSESFNIYYDIGMWFWY